jgi:hypothetical protein
VASQCAAKTTSEKNDGSMIVHLIRSNVLHPTVYRADASPRPHLDNVPMYNFIHNHSFRLILLQHEDQGEKGDDRE